MTVYPFDSLTRVAVTSTLADLSAPTLTELASATDVACDLVPSGLAIERGSGTTPRTYWKGRQSGAVPTRWSTSVGLSGYRRTSGEVLYPLCVFGARAILIVRYGLAYDDAWAAGQSVDVISGRWGKRSTAKSGRNAAVTFEVPLIVVEDDDDATVVA